MQGAAGVATVTFAPDDQLSQDRSVWAAGVSTQRACKT